MADEFETGTFLYSALKNSLKWNLFFIFFLFQGKKQPDFL